MTKYGAGKGSLSQLNDAILYDVAPYLNKKGAHAWIEELSRSAVVVGFSCWNDGARGELWTWSSNRLSQLLREASFAMVRLRDFSDVRPSQALADRTGPAPRAA